MKTSYAQIQRILQTESFSPTAYKDGQTAAGVQHFSIGYGHQIAPSESYLLTSVIDVNKAMALFQSDLSPLEDQVNNGSVNDLSQDQFDAFIDFGFNCGSGALDNVLSTWNTTGDAGQTVARMELYNKTRKNGVLTVSDALNARRLEEGNEFLAGAAAFADAAGSAVSDAAAAITGGTGAPLLLLLVLGGLFCWFWL